MSERGLFPQRIETERLLIRPLESGDALEVNAAIRETYDDLHQWMSWADHLPTVEETQEICLHNYEKYRWQEDYTLAARLKDNGVLVACLGLHPRDREVPGFEVGFWCRSAFQGQGYVAEAVRALLQTGFEVMGANRIEMRCDVRNLRSRRVAERTGFRLEGVLRNEQVAPDGRLRNTLVFSLLPHEFQALKSSR